MGKENEKPFARFRKSFNKTKNNSCADYIKKEIKKTDSQLKGISDVKLLQILSCAPNFLGVFAEDETKHLTFSSFPSYIIVNLDQRSMSGSHWIAIGIFQNTLEIFDSLGFQVFNWPRLPLILFQLLHRLSISRHIVISSRIQSDISTFCGFYAIFYVLARHDLSFHDIQSIFKTNTTDNDKILLKLFS